MGEQRTGRTRGLAAVAALAVATLSGCSLVGDGQQVWDILQTDAGLSDALAAAVAEIRGLDGVDGASSRFLAAGPHGAEVDLNVAAAADATTQELSALAAVAGDALAGDPLSSATRLFTLQIGDGGMLQQSVFAITEAQLAAEIAYWQAAQDAIGAGLYLNLTESGGEPPYAREFGAAENTDTLRVTEQFIANYTKLQKVEDASQATTWWSLPGLFFQPELPPAEVIGLLGEISDISPLLDYSGIPEDLPFEDYPEGAAVGWSPWLGGDLRNVSVTVSQRAYRASDWPGVLKVAAITAAHPDAFFNYATPDGRQFRFYTGPCGGEADANDDDRMLVDALAQAGTPLRPGGGPGFCPPTVPNP